MIRLVIIGFGYSAAALMRALPPGTQVSATVRARHSFAKVERHGAQPLLFDGLAPNPDLAMALSQADHVLISAPPGASGDPLLLHHWMAVRHAPHLGWIGYLSTVGVYGHHEGGWVDEATPTAPTSERGKFRVAAENSWRALAAETSANFQIFRLGGIYGPGRNTLIALAEGSQRRVVKPGQVFNRIHVDDIAGLVAAGLVTPKAGPVLNGVDDAPAPPQDVVVYAAQLMGLAPPPEVNVNEAGLSPMGLSFYAENKRVSNVKTKAALGYQFLFPSYREGLASLAQQRDWEQNAPPDA